MEVGAVKQAFNNEVILLKKKLNQAKTQVIHKLTRKAKTLTEKKAPDHLKEKLKRKAESAVNEVLIMKKIKAKDIAKFIITHTGELKSFLNRPKVDNDRACARLVLHKSLQDKYKFIRNRFGNVPIKDLFMSRQERRKLKKEAREQQKNKKKGKKGKVVNSAGDWDVEDVDMGDDSKDISKNGIENDDDGTNVGSDHSEAGSIEQSDDEHDSEGNNLVNEENSDDDQNSNSGADRNDDEDLVQSKDIDEADDDDEVEAKMNDEAEVEEKEDSEIGKFIRLKPQNEIKNPVQNLKHPKSRMLKLETNLKPQTAKIDKIIKEKKQIDRKVKENKNKNLKEKLQNRKFKTDEDDNQVEGRKVIDPFFITASGGNYLSLAEPRAPDEVKEVHKQGNRQQRRANMFGTVPKIKPRKNNFSQNNFGSKFDTQNGYNSGNRNDRFNNGYNFNDRNAKFNDGNSKFNDRNSKYSDRNDKFNDRNANYDKRNSYGNSNFNDRNSSNISEKKDEKLHPSWEAKRKLKSMSLLPAQGKKIVFD